MPDATTIDPVAAAARAGVRIRAAEPEDVPAISRTMSDPGVVRGTLQLPYTPHALRRERFTFTDVNTCFVVAEPLDGGEPIGNAGLHRNTRPRRIHSAALGMSVRDDWQGRGVGTALLAALLDVADNWWQVTRVHLDVYVDNEPAIALYRKFGFEIEGTLRHDTFRDGEYVDAHVMARLRDGSARERAGS
ncbi:MAG: GNAT family N-acetyltransferase [Thermoleophilia bacterium]|nr:GNAT family N-acetyltransferase [Thermoleophilia bacterium]